MSSLTLEDCIDEARGQDSIGDAESRALVEELKELRANVEDLRLANFNIVLLRREVNAFRDLFGIPHNMPEDAALLLARSKLVAES